MHNKYHKQCPNKFTSVSVLTIGSTDTQFKWDTDCENSFNWVKTYLTNKPVLSIYDSNKECILYTDASKIGTGAVLKQMQSDSKLHPIGYFSRKLLNYQKNYNVSELECLALVQALDYWHHYLYGNQVIVYSDHNPLKWLNSIKKPTTRLFNWALRIGQYNPDVRYITGKTNIGADLLSRNPVLEGPAQQPFDIISIDTVGGLAGYNSKKQYIHVAIDNFSRFLWTTASSTQSAKDFIQLIKNVCQTHKPKLILADSGNHLSQLSHFNGCTSLHTLVLHSNSMTTIPLFKCCQHLQVLDISNNCFDEKLITGNNLDILFNNCSSLKHLDMIASGGFNARNVINRSQYLTVPVNERLIHLVDMTSAVSHCQIAISNSFINSAVCVEVLSESELVLCLINGTKYAPIIKSNFSSILEQELGCIETKNHYLKNSILSMFKLLSDRKCENLNNVNIILAHLKLNTDGGPVTVKVATCGQWISLRQVPLNQNCNNNNCNHLNNSNHSNSSCNNNSNNNNSSNNSNNSRSPKIINLCSKPSTIDHNHKPLLRRNCSIMRQQENGFIGDPICHELTLSATDNRDQWALLMGISVVDHEEEDMIQELFASNNSTASLMTLTDKLKRYTEVINAKNNYLNNCDDCDNHCFGANFLALAIHRKSLIHENRNIITSGSSSSGEEDMSLQSSSCNTSDTNDSEHSEKYRSWEYILEENHKCLFSKELEALKEVDTNKFDSISSRKYKSTSAPIISLQQFITTSNKKFDSNVL
ncbi:putative uncharacterized protein DDB_G0267840 [Oppia nitens]|uniref:putative uncharacterized protein DDB_G0267840 n=1 Tax=Oppia nitens TaxID=1686743 RepID=UPI0023DB9CC7|nr:putative uncharacterized protein DDB_G0267840 [Oppia nitens]